MTQTHSPLFRSFFHGGFECATPLLRTSRRIDQIAATRHDELAADDYARLRAHGIAVAREGLRWHLIERVRGWYDWKSVLPMLRAARDAGIQVVWDACHFGWPDALDPFQPEFVERLAKMSRAFAQMYVAETDEAPYLAPVNEIGLLSWLGGEVGQMNPFEQRRGFELKCNLVRASIAVMDAVREVAPKARFFHHEPVFDSALRSEDGAPADALQYEFQVWDMLAGRLWPQLGGGERFLDVIGINYYLENVWRDVPNARAAGGPKWPQAGVLEELLATVHARYQRPMCLAETGCANEERVAWLAATGDAVAAAMARGVPIEGVCLYPVLNYPAWEGGQHCQNGLWDHANEQGERAIYAPLAAELARQQARFAEPSVLYGAGIEAQLMAAGGRLL